MASISRYKKKQKIFYTITSFLLILFSVTLFIKLNNINGIEKEGEKEGEKIAGLREKSKIKDSLNFSSIDKKSFYEIATCFLDTVIDNPDKLNNYTKFLLFINNNMKNQSKIKNVSSDEFKKIRLYVERQEIFKYDDNFFKKRGIKLKD